MKMLIAVGNVRAEKWQMDMERGRWSKGKIENTVGEITTLAPSKR